MLRPAATSSARSHYANGRLQARNASPPGDNKKPPAAHFAQELPLNTPSARHSRLLLLLLLLGLRSRLPTDYFWRAARLRKAQVGSGGGARENLFAESKGAVSQPRSISAAWPSVNACRSAPPPAGAPPINQLPLASSLIKQSRSPRRAHRAFRVGGGRAGAGGRRIYIHKRANGCAKAPKRADDDIILALRG